MTITLEQMYEMQKTLDERIIREKGLEGQDLLPNTVLALQVEIGELANEWRGFKHWSNDREPRIQVKCAKCDGFGFTYKGYAGVGWARVSSEKVMCDCSNGYRNPLLEEYVDCLHFFLSIARQLELPADDLYIPDDFVEGETTVIFIELLHTVARIGAEYYAPKPALTQSQRFRAALNIFFALGEQRLGFTWEQIAAAYVEKNKVNHERQGNGY